MEAVNGGSLGEDKGGPPPPSPLTGCYLLVVIGEPHSEVHKDIILQKVAKGLLSWNVNDCLVDLEKELAIITQQGLEGEEARYGERLIQFASENLVTEILIHPAVSTLSQCVRNLLSSFTRHRHIIHAGYTFQGNGSWALQDGTFSYSDFAEAFQEIEVQRVIHAYENGISIDLHCTPEGDWTRLPKEFFTKFCKVRVNPTDILTTGSPSISSFTKYLEPFLVPSILEDILESSDVVGNIRFSRPTLYVFPGGQGDAALFGINGFNMLLDGGYSRKACFWDFVRHLDRLDAVLMTRLNNSSISGVSSVLKRKKQGAIYPQLGHFFCNIQERKSLLSPDGDKDKDPLIISLLEEGQNIIQDLHQLNLSPQACYRDSDPIILYHKVGHGTLNMYVLSPDKNSRDVREFLQKWNQNDSKLFVASKTGKEFTFPLQNLISICALLVWQPANPNDTITRILYPGSTPQKKIFDGLDRLKSLECMKHPVCTVKSVLPSKKSKQDIIEKLAAKEMKAPIISEKKIENKTIMESSLKNNGEMNGDVINKDKQVKKLDSLESDKEKRLKKADDSKIVENGEKPKAKVPKTKPRAESQPRKRPSAEKKGPPTPKKSIENKANGEAKAALKPSPSATPAKSTKDANNRRVIESKKAPVKKEIVPKAAAVEAKHKPERKPISRRPKTIKGPPSPMKKMPNGVQKLDSLSKRGKLDKEGTTDSSTVSTPSADQESILKKDISKLTPEEFQQLKDKELEELQEEQEAVKEIEAVFRKGETRHEESEPGVRKIKEVSIDDNLDTEEYLIIEKEEVEHDSLDQNEDEMQKLVRDSEESEKQRKLSSEEDKLQIQEKVISEAEPSKMSKELDLKKVEDKVADKKEPVEEVIESHPEEKVSANVESGATTTAPTLPEDERITLDEIKEDNGQVVEEKHVKEETKEKEIPIIQLPPKSLQDSQPKAPQVVGIALDKQKQVRDIVKTPDEVADLPVHEEADYQEFQGDEKKSNELVDKVDVKKADKIVPEQELEKKDAKDEAEITKDIAKEILVDKEPNKQVESDIKTKDSVIISQKTEEIEESYILEKADVETNEDAVLVEKEVLKESIDEEWVVISKEDENKKEKVETAEEADKVLKESTDFIAKEVEHERQTRSTQEISLPPKPSEETEKDSDTTTTESNHEICKEDEVQDVSSDKEKDDIKALIEEADKKPIKDKIDEKTKQTKEEIATTETKIHELEKESQDEKIYEIKDKLQELEIESQIEKIKETKDEIAAIDSKLKKLEKKESQDEKIHETKETIQELEIKLQVDKINDTKDEIAAIETKLEKLEKESQDEKINEILETKQKTAAIESKIQEPKKDISIPLEDIKLEKPEKDLKIKELDHQPDTKEKLDNTGKTEKDEIVVEKSTRSPEHAESVVLPDSSPEDDGPRMFKDIDKLELGRKSPAEREDDVKKIVASVAEVLKSEAPLEEFAKLPFTQELRETHITTQDSPILEAKIIKTEDIIPPIPEEPHEEDINATKEDDELGTVHRMLVTASSEDGGEEIEICPAGTITFSKSSESSGRSSPDPSQKTQSQKSSIVETLSDTFTTVKQVSESHVKVDDFNVIQEAVQAVEELVKGNLKEEFEKSGTVQENLEETVIDLKKEEIKEKDMKEDESPKKVKGEVKITEDKKSGYEDTAKIDSKKVETVQEDKKDSIEVKEPLKDEVKHKQDSPKKEMVTVDKTDIKITSKSEEEKDKDISEIFSKDSIDSKQINEQNVEEISAKVLEEEKQIEKPKEPAKMEAHKPDEAISDSKTIKTDDLVVQDKKELKDTEQKIAEASTEATTTESKILDSISGVFGKLEQEIEDIEKKVVEFESSSKKEEEKHDESLPAVEVPTAKRRQSIIEKPQEFIDKSEEAFEDVLSSVSTKAHAVLDNIIKSEPESKEPIEDTTSELKDAKTLSTQEPKESKDLVEDEKKDSPRKSVSESKEVSSIESEKLSHDVTSILSKESTPEPQVDKDAVELPVSIDPQKSSSSPPEDHIDTLTTKSKDLTTELTEESKLEEIEKDKPIDHISEERRGSIIETAEEFFEKSEKTLGSMFSAIGSAAKSVLDDILPDKEKEEAKLEETPKIDTEAKKEVDRIDAKPVISKISTSEPKDLVNEPKKGTIDGKSTPELMDAKKEEIIDSRKSSGDDHIEKSSALSGKSTPEPKDTKKEEIIGSRKLSADDHIEKSPALSGKSTPEPKDTKKEEIIGSRKPSADDHIEKSPALSGKSTPELKDVKKEEIIDSRKLSAVDHIEKSPALSGKSTPEPKDAKEKEIIDSRKPSADDHIEKSLALSGKSTPEPKDSKEKEIIDSRKPSMDDHIEKLSALSGKFTPEPKDAKEKEIIDSRKASVDDHIEKPLALSGKSTPESKDATKEEVVYSQKPSEDDHIEKSSALSGKSTPEPKDAKEKEIINSRKASVDDHIEKPLALSGKSTPEPKDAKEKEIIESRKPSANDHIEKSPALSGKSTPEPEDAKKEEVIDSRKPPVDNHIEKSLALSGKSTPEPKDAKKEEVVNSQKPSEDDHIKKSPALSGKSTPEPKDAKKEEVIDSQKASADHIDKSEALSGKSSPDPKSEKKEAIIDSRKPSMDDYIEKSPVLSGKSTPEPKYDHIEKSPALSGKSTPEPKDVKKEEIIDSRKSSADAHIEKSQALSVKSTPEPKDAKKEEIIDSRKPSADDHMEKSPALSGKSTPEPKDAKKEEIIDSRKSFGDDHIAKSQALSGKSTPEPKDAKKEEIIIDSRKPSADDHMEKSPALAGKFTPEPKDAKKEEIIDSRKSSGDDHIEISQALPGKSTPEPKDAKKEEIIIDSRKPSADDHMEKSPALSGKSTPEPKDAKKEEIIDSRKSSGDDHIEKSQALPGKSTPEPKDAKKEELVDSRKPSADDHIEKSPALSGKSTPEIKDAKKEDVIDSRRSSRVDPIEKAQAPSGKSTPEAKEVQKDEIVDFRKLSGEKHIDGKSTPESKHAVEELKGSKDIIPDSHIDTSPALSRKSTPEPKQTVKDSTKLFEGDHIEAISEKSTSELKDVTDTAKDLLSDSKKLSEAQIESTKSEGSVDNKKDFKDPVDSKKLSESGHLEASPAISEKTTLELKDSKDLVGTAEQDTEYLLSDSKKLSEEGHLQASGKSTPEIIGDTKKDSVDHFETFAVPSGKSTTELKEDVVEITNKDVKTLNGDIETSYTLSGKSTPELKEVTRKESKVDDKKLLESDYFDELKESKDTKDLISDSKKIEAPLVSSPELTKVIDSKKLSEIDHTHISGKSTSDAKEPEDVKKEVPTVLSGKSTPEHHKSSQYSTSIEETKLEESKEGKLAEHISKERRGSVIEAAEEFIESSEKALSSVFSAIGSAAKSVLEDILPDKDTVEDKDAPTIPTEAELAKMKSALVKTENFIEQKSDQLIKSTKDKDVDIKDTIEQETKDIKDRIEDITKAFDKVEKTIGTITLEKVDTSKDIKKEEMSSDKDQLQDEVKVDKDAAETEKKQEVSKDTIGKQIDDKESVSFEPDKDYQVDKESISKIEKKIEDQAMHISETVEEISELAQSIPFEKCHQKSANEKIDQSKSEAKVDKDAVEKELDKSDISTPIEHSSESKVDKDALEKEAKPLEEFKISKQTIKKEEKIIEDQVKLVSEKADSLSDLTSAASFQKCAPNEEFKIDQDIIDQQDKKIEAEVSQINENVEDLTKLNKSISFDKCKIKEADKSHEEVIMDSNKVEHLKHDKESSSQVNLCIEPTKTEEIVLQAKDSIVLDDHPIPSQTEKCEKESMEKTSSLKIMQEPKKLSISDVEISIKTDIDHKDVIQSFLDNERTFICDKTDAKVYIPPKEEDQDKSSPETELSGKATPPTQPISPVITKDLQKSPSLKLDSGLSEQTETDEEDLSTKSQIAHSQSDFDELDMKLDPMSMSLYGALPEELESEAVAPTYLYEITKAKYGADIKVEEKVDEGMDLMTASFIGDLPSSSTTAKPESKKDPVDSWGKPLGLPAPTYLYEVTKAKFSSQSETKADLMTSSFIGELPTSNQDPMTTSVYFGGEISDSSFDPIAAWGKPLGLPSPAPPNNNEKGTPKKEKKLSAYVSAKNKLNEKRAESPSKLKSKKVNAIYVDLTYVPHHGNHYYSYVDFFKRIRARYYVFSGLEPSKQVYDALLEAKQTWEDGELEVTIIPTYDTDILGYWVAENEELLSKFKIDLAPSASRCTINLQDHETSCSAYRLEF